MVTISFPGLGIDNFNLKSVAFTLFGKFDVRWYGLIITTGILLAIAYAAFRFKREKISFDDLLDMSIFAILFGIIGARAYYVLTSLEEYNSFYDVIAIWEGGIAIYGALIGGGLAVLCVCKYKKISFFKVADAVAPGVMIAQTLGRWGNFCNGEAFGEIVSEGHPLHFMRMGLVSENIIQDFKTFAMVYVHPTFLYESMWNLLGFILINIFYKKKKFNGQIALMYFAWYGFGRMFIEGLRTDSLFIPGTGIRISQMLGLVLLIASVIVIAVGLVLAYKNKLAAVFVPNYVPDIKKFREEQKQIEADRVAAKRAARMGKTQDAETEQKESEDREDGDNH